MIKLTVGDLRNRIKDLPDDMDVIIQVSCGEDTNYIELLAARLEKSVEDEKEKEDEN